ncbi:DUF2723 domain-containing protein [Pontiellaceae bacterium B12219]|nr:DUF2723 domain-containing protein [Pontiellaceae bacterium B12219]
MFLFALYTLTAPQNHSEAEDVYDFALRVEQGHFADQAGVNRVLALPMFGRVYRAAQAVGYSGRAFPFMIFMNRLLAVGCFFLFYRLLSYCGRPACSSDVSAEGIEANVPPEKKLQTTLLFAFSYGFWRYANEAETYILASLLVLVAWNLVLSSSSLVHGETPSDRCHISAAQEVNFKLQFVLCSLISALGILVHLLNLIPLLLIIPLFYLLSKEWKKALLHGALTGLLVIAGYAVCAPWLDFSALGAQHHAAEGGITFSNFLRGGIAFGQNLISANFLFGFESFRELLAMLFPSRMLDEEFYMASKMARWIPGIGVATLSLLVFWCLWLAGKIFGNKDGLLKIQIPKPLTISLLIWLMLYALAVIRTEAGSPELWIMALIPFWWLVGPLLKGRSAWVLVILLFAHNLIGGLLPVMSQDSDYHAKKSAWLLEHISEEDLVLTSYEPILIFYLNYYCPAQLLNSSENSLEQIKDAIGMSSGNIYAFNTFFQPLDSMQVRSPDMYERMLETGNELSAEFMKVEKNEFGGIYALRQ